MTGRVGRLCTVYTATLIVNETSLSKTSSINFSVRLPVFAINRATRLTGVRPRALHRCSHLNLIHPRHASNNTHHCYLHSVTHLAQTRHLDRSRNVGLSNVTHVLILRRRGHRLHHRIGHVRANSRRDIFTTNHSNGVIRVRHSGHTHL